MNNIMKREFRVNLKSFIIWLSSIVAFVLMIMLMYPLISENADEFMSLMESFPESLMESFGYGADSFSSAIKFYGGEGYLFVNLIFFIYVSMLGGGILSKEESEGTSEYLLVKPVSRRKIINSKKAVVFTYMSLITIVVFLINLLLLTIVDTVDFTGLVLISILPLIAALTFSSIATLISVFISKPRKVLSLGIGMVLGSYVLQVISLISDKVEFLKYFSIFEYINAIPLVNDHSVNFTYVGIMLVIIIITNILSTKFYISKDIGV